MNTSLQTKEYQLWRKRFAEDPNLKQEMAESGRLLYEIFSLPAIEALRDHLDAERDAKREAEKREAEEAEKRETEKREAAKRKFEAQIERNLANKIPYRWRQDCNAFKISYEKILYDLFMGSLTLIAIVMTIVMQPFCCVWDYF